MLIFLLSRNCQIYNLVVFFVGTSILWLINICSIFVYPEKASYEILSRDARVLTNPEKCHQFKCFSFLFLVAFPVMRCLFAIHRLLYWRKMGISYNIWSGKRILKYGGEFLAKLSIVRLEFGKQFDLFCLSIVFVNMALLSYWYSLLYWPVQCISDIGGETWRKCLEILSGSLSFFSVSNGCLTNKI